MKLKNRIAVVTGGAQGIGEVICHAYAKEGAVIVIADKNLEAGSRVAEAIQKEGGKAQAIQCDVANAQSVKAMMQQVLTEFNRIDIVFNSAGIYQGKLIEDYTEAEWDRTLDINLKGTFLVSQAAVPTMKQQRYGKIICIASIMASVADTLSAPYCASKAGVLGLVKAFTTELASYNINVNAISPGFVATPLNEEFRKDPMTVEAKRQKTPSGEAYMDPKELIGAALFLAADDSRAVHGIDLLVDNGWCAV